MYVDSTPYVVIRSTEHDIVYGITEYMRYSVLVCMACYRFIKLHTNP
jgi:hypothetical protein